MNNIRNQRIQRQNKARIEEVRKKEKLDRITAEASHEVELSKILLEREFAQRQQRTRELLAGEGDSPSKDLTG